MVWLSGSSLARRYAGAKSNSERNLLLPLRRLSVEDQSGPAGRGFFQRTKRRIWSLSVEWFRQTLHERARIIFSAKRQVRQAQINPMSSCLSGLSQSRHALSSPFCMFPTFVIAASRCPESNLFKGPSSSFPGQTLEWTANCGQACCPWRSANKCRAHID
jgi:hypothetical protein